MNKKIIFYGLSLATLLAIFFCLKSFEPAEILPVSLSSPLKTIVSTSTATQISQIQEKKIQINFIAGANNYSVNVPDGSTAYDTMNILASTTDFSFKSVFYSGIGYFVEEINNVKNSGGQYWTLYVNGKYSDVGASDYILSSGDIIEWKYEK